MLNISKVNVFPDFGSNHNHISYLLDPTTQTVSNFQVEIQKSLSPNDTYTTIGIIPSDTVTYEDSDVYLFDGFRKYYYQLKITDKSTSDVDYTDSSYSSYEYVPVTREIVRQEGIYLSQYTKNQVKFLIRKTQGQKCSCYDAVKKRVLTSHCSDCYGTGFSGGYYVPISGYVSNTPLTEEIRLLLGIEMSSTDTVYWTGNTPKLSPADIMVDTLGNQRWRINRVQSSSLQNYPVRQQLVVSLIKPTDPEYYISIS